MVKISIIVPVYNVKKYVSRCLDSLLSQTFKEIEIIIIDDSTDSTTDILLRYAKEYKDKIIYHRNLKKQGIGFTRNIGLDLVKGEYIAFVDSDDYIENDMYQILYDEAIKTNSDIVYGNFFKDNDLTKGIEVYQMPVKPTKPYKLSENKETFKNFDYPVVWNKIYRTVFIKENNFKFGVQKYVEDVGFTLSVFLKANKISYVDKPLYHYMIYREGSLMNKYESLLFECMIDSYNYVLKYYQKNSQNSEFDDYLETYMISTIIEFTKLNFYINDNNQKEKYILFDYLDKKFPNWKSKIEKGEIISQAYRYIKICDNILDNENLFKNKKVVIFSASLGGKTLYKFFKKADKKVFAFCDNAKELHGKLIENIPILSVETAAEIYKEKGYFIIGADSKYYEVIKEQLVSLGIKEENIY